MKFFTDIWNELVARYEARHEPEQLLPLVEMYWRGLLIVSLSCIVGAVLFGIWQFITVIENMSAAQAGSPVSIPSVLDRKKLEGVLQAYDNRASQYSDVKSRAATATDPSR